MASIPGIRSQALSRFSVSTARAQYFAYSISALAHGSKYLITMGLDEAKTAKSKQLRYNSPEQGRAQNSIHKLPTKRTCAVQKLFINKIFLRANSISTAISSQWKRN
jgi:hypothetical protein